MLAIVSPSVVRLHDYGSLVIRGESCPFICTDFIDGTTISAALSDGPLSVPSAARIGSDLLLAIEALWAQKLVHRDVEVLPAAHVERVLRDYYTGLLGDADFEERLLRDEDEGQFRAICQNALEGLASKKLDLDMLID